MTFGQKLQQLRKARGMSQEDLAQKLSVTRQTISKWELDQSTPDLSSLALISDLFTVSTDYLIKEQPVAHTFAPQMAQADMDALLTKLQRKRPSARQVCLALFFIGLAGIVLPWLLLVIMELFSLNIWLLVDISMIIFVFSIVLTVVCGLSAAILTLQERKPMK